MALCATTQYASQVFDVHAQPDPSLDVRDLQLEAAARRFCTVDDKACGCRVAETPDLQLVHGAASGRKNMEVQVLQKKQNARAGVYALAPREEADKPKNMQRMSCDKRHRET